MKLTYFIKDGKITGYATGNAEYDTVGTTKVEIDLSENNIRQLKDGTSYPVLKNGKVLLKKRQKRESKLKQLEKKVSLLEKR